MPDSAWKVLLLTNLWSVYWKVYPNLSPRETTPRVKHNVRRSTITNHENFIMLRKLFQPVGFSAALYVYQTIKAAIKIVVKSRHPSARHVTRTHRVDLDWLFEPVNHDSTISVKYNNTKDQIADRLTKGRFAVQQWTTLIHVFATYTHKLAVQFRILRRRLRCQVLWQPLSKRVKERITVIVSGSTVPTV